MFKPALKCVATVSECKLLRDAGVIIIHPDCHVSFSTRIAKANALKTLREAADQGRLYYRDLRLYAFPEPILTEKPKKNKARRPKAVTQPVAPVVVTPAVKYTAETLPVQFRAKSTQGNGRLYNRRMASFLNWYEALPAGQTFTRRDIAKQIGEANLARVSSFMYYSPALKGMLNQGRVDHGVYSKV